MRRNRMLALVTLVLVVSGAALAVSPSVTPMNDPLDLEQDPFEGPQQAVGVSVAPTIALGPSAQYFSPGAKVSLAYAMEFPLSWALLRPGFSVGAQYMYAQGTVRTSHMILVPFAVETSLVFLQENLIQPAVSVRAGASYLAMVPPAEATVSKVVPYVGTEVSVSFVRPSGVRLEGAVALDLYAEATMLVWVLSPTFQVKFPL